MAGNRNKIPVESKMSNVRLLSCEIPKPDSTAPLLISISIQAIKRDKPIIVMFSHTS